MQFWKLRQLKARSWETRRDAALALAGSTDPKVTEALAEALFDPTEAVAAAATSVLLDSGEEGLAAILDASRSSARRDGGQSGRRLAAALSARADPLVVERLASALDRQRPAMRLEAVKLLSALDDPRRIGALEKALSDSDEGVVAEAAEALSRAGNAAVPALVGAFERGSAALRRRAVRALARTFGPPALEALSRALRDPDVEVRRLAAWAIGEQEDPARLDDLLAALRDPSAGVAQEAAAAAAKIGDPRAVEALVSAARFLTAPGANQAFVLALARFGDPRALGFLLQRLDHPDPKLVATTAEALGAFKDPQACDALIAKLDHGHETVRVAAARSLARIGHPMAIAALTIALERATRQRLPEQAEMAKALQQLQSPAPTAPRS
jgi:HEAT repeat protein